MMFNFKRFLCLAILGCFPLAGCEPPKPPKSEAEVLLDRAHAYWEAARVFDLYTMYQMELGVKEGRFIAADLGKMLTGSKTRVVSFELKNPQVNGDTGTVELDLRVTLNAVGGKGWNVAPTQDKWNKVDGVWYHGMTKEQGEAAVKAAQEAAAKAAAEAPGTSPSHERHPAAQSPGAPPANPLAPHAPPPPAN